MRYPFTPFFVAPLLLLPPSAAAFCNAPRPRLVCAEFFSSPLIVQATLAQTESLHDKDDPEGISAYVYTLQVNQVIRGRAAGRLRVYEENDSGRATFDWVRGQRYLLFLSPSNGSWSLDGCGNSGPLSKAAIALADIAKLKGAKNGGGMIQGVVNGPNFAATQPSSGMHVVAKSASGSFNAVTNKDGEFRMNVPAGRYVVNVNEPGLSFRPFEFTYESPDALQIQPGGCGQVQFVDSQR